MALTDFIAFDAVVPGIRAATKKQVLQDVSERASGICGLSARDIFDVLLQRERLGSTGVGEGIAIPHGKLAGCEKMFGLLGRLERPVEFEAHDGIPVDLVFLLLAPEWAGADHLKALAQIARFTRVPGRTAALRAARDAFAIYALLGQDVTSNAA